MSESELMYGPLKKAFSDVQFKGREREKKHLDYKMYCLSKSP